MASTKIEVQLGIKADVSAAKKAIAGLEDSLNKLYTKQEQYNFQDLGLNEAVKTAKELEICLNRALNQTTGKLDLSAFQTGLKSAGLTLDQLNEKLLGAGQAGQQVFTSLAASIAQAELPLKKTSKLVSEFTRSIKNVFTYQISAGMFQAISSSLSGAVSYAKELNTSLNDIRIVTGQSVEQMAKFAVEANKSAQKLSTTTSSYAKASLIFYQQGLSDAEVKKRTDAVIKMANVTKESADDVSSYMTAIWNNFDDGSKSLERYADVMTALGAATASSTKEIAAGLEKFASIGKTIGLSYEYATSAVATIVDKTRQSAETVGTGLRTIFSRLQGLSLGETLEDGVDLNKYSSALKTVGVNILDASGNMKDMDEILDSLAGKWKNLSNAQKTALAQTVGGVRQYTTLISLMDNWGSMEQNLRTANTSAGTLQQQQDIYAEGWEAASQRSKAALEELYQTLLNDKGFIALTNGLTSVTQAVTTLVSAMGGLPGILSTVGMIATRVFSHQISGGVTAAIGKLTTWSSQFQNQGFFKSAMQVIRGQSQSAAQVRAGQAFLAQERSYGSKMEALKSRGQGNSIEYMAAEQAQALIGRKRLLMENEYKLTQEQKDRAQDKINALSEAQQKRIALRQEAAEQSKEFEKLERNSTARWLAANVSRQITFGPSIGQNRSDAQQLKRLYYLSGLQGIGDWQIKKRGSDEERRVNLENMLTSTRVSSRNQALAASFNSADLKDPQQRKEAIKKINAFFGKGTLNDDASLDDVENKLAEISQKAAATRAEIDQLIKVSDADSSDQRAAKEKLKEMLDEADEQGAQWASRDIETGYVREQIDTTKKDIDKFIQGEGGKFGDVLATGIEKGTTALGGLTAGFTQAAAAAQILGESGASAGEIIASIGSLATGAMSAFATGGPLALLAYGVGAAGSLIYNKMDKEYHKEELAADEADTSAERLMNSYREIQAEYNDMLSNVDVYETASELLSQLVIGTDEWKEALIDANDAALELINNFNLIQGQDYEIGPNGQITFTKEGNDKIETGQSEMLNDTVVAQSAANLAQAEAAAARARANADIAVRENNPNRTGQMIGNIASGAAAGAAIGTILPGIGNIVGFIGGALIGGLAGLIGQAELDRQQELEDEKEERKIKDISNIYKMSNGTMTDDQLKEQLKTQFQGASDSYIASLMEVVKATVEAERQLDDAMALAASSVLNANKVYSNIKDQQVQEDIQQRATEVYSEAYQMARDGFDQNISNETLRTKYQDQYIAQLRSNNENGFTATKNDDGSFTYSYIGADGHRTEEFEVSASDLKTYIASDYAQERVNAQVERWESVFTNLRQGSAQDRAAAAFGGKGLRTATLEEFNALNDEQDYKNYFSHLNKNQLEALGFESASEAMLAFSAEINGPNGLQAAWGQAISGMGDFNFDTIKHMSLDIAQAFSNLVNDLNKGPIQNAGKLLSDGLTMAFKEAQVKDEDKTELLAQIAQINWGNYDAFEQFTSVFDNMGYSIDEANSGWKVFVDNMRQAAVAVPDFSKLKANINNVAKISKDLKLGDAIDEEDYQLLIKYHEAWADLFVLQADGSRQFIGDSDEIQSVMRQKIEDQKTLLDFEKKVSALEDVQQINWTKTDDEQTLDQFTDAYIKNQELQDLLLNEGGYSMSRISEIVQQAKLGNTAELEKLFGWIGKSLDPNTLSQTGIELESMLASLASSLEELQALNELGSENGGISDTTYSKQLIVLASQYDYCATAIKNYREALASNDKDRIAAAREALETTLALEEEAKAYDTMYKNALSGKSNLTVEDLTNLQKTNAELYNSFLSMSDEEWYQSAYEAYSAWLELRLEGHAQDSAEYKAMMLEKEAIDKEYYASEQDKQKQALDIMIKDYQDQIGHIEDVLGILSGLSSGDKMFQDLSFEELNELETKLQEIGYTAEEVDALLKNLGKDEKKTDKESVLAAMRAEVDMLLSGIAATDAQKTARYTGLTTTLTIDDVQLGDNISSNESGEIVVGATATAEVGAAPDNETTESAGEGAGLRIKNLKNPAHNTATVDGAGGTHVDGDAWVVDNVGDPTDNATVTVDAEGDGTVLASDFSTLTLSNPNIKSNASALFGVSLEQTAEGAEIQNGTLYMGTDGILHFKGDTSVGEVTFSANIGDKGQILYDPTNGLYLNALDENGIPIDVKLNPSESEDSLITYSEKEGWKINAQTDDGIPIKISLKDEDIPEFLKNLRNMTEEEQEKYGIDLTDGLNVKEIRLLYTWDLLEGGVADPTADIPGTEEDDPLIIKYKFEPYEGFDDDVQDYHASEEKQEFLAKSILQKTIQGLQSNAPENFDSLFQFDDLETEYETTRKGKVRQVEWTRSDVPGLQRYINEEDTQAKDPEEVLKDYAELFGQLSVSRSGNTSTVHVGNHLAYKGDSWTYDDGLEFVHTLDSWNDIMFELESQTQQVAASFRDLVIKGGMKENEWFKQTAENTGFSEEGIKNMLIAVISQNLSNLDPDSEAYQAGADLLHGLLLGYNESDIEGFAYLGSQVLQVIRLSLAENSPSKATMEMGRNLMAGLNIGWNSAEFEVGDVKGKVLDAIATELQKIDQLDIGKIPIGWDADKDPEDLNTISDLGEEWTGIDLRKNSEADAAYDERRTQLRYMESYLLSKREGGITKDTKPTLFNADGTFVMDEAGLNEQQKAIFAQAYGNKYQSVVNAETGKITIKIDGMDDMDFDNWSKAYEHALATAFSNVKVTDWLVADNETTREGLDSIQNAIVSEAIKQYLAKNPSYGSIKDAINKAGLDSVLAEVQSIIDKGYGELNNYSEKSWAKIKDSWIEGAQKALEIDKTAAQEYYNMWVSTFEAIAKARKIIFEEGNLGLELDEKTISQLATDAILGTKGTSFDPITWLNDLFNPEKNNIKTYGLPAYQSGVSGTNAQFLNYNEAGFLSNNQSSEQFKQSYSDYFTTYWQNHMTADALSPYLLVLNKTKEELLKSDEAKKYGLVNEQGVLENDTYTRYLQQANLLKVLEVITTDKKNNAIFNNQAAESVDLKAKWSSITNNEDLSTILNQIFATTLGQQMGREAAYRQKIEADSKTKFEQQRDTAVEDQKLVQKAIQDGKNALTAEERDKLDKIMKEGGYGSLEEANTGLASSADAAAAGLDRLVKALSQGYTTDGKGNWFKPSDIKAGDAIEGSGTKDAGTFATIEAAQEWAATQGYNLGDWTFDTKQQQLSSYSIQTSDDGKYYLRKDVVPASAVMTEDGQSWAGLSEDKGYYTDATNVEREERAAALAGMSLDELREYTDYLIDQKELTGEVNHANIMLAASYARVQNGLKSVNTNLKNYSKALKDAQKKTTEHKKALDDMRKLYGDVLDLDKTGMDALTEDFMQQTDVLKLLEDSAKGVKGAYDKLQAKTATHILGQLAKGEEISSMTDELTALSTAVNELPEGKALNWNELLGAGEIGQAVAGNLASLASFVSGLASNANEASGIMQALAAALGMDMVVDTKEFPVSQMSYDATTGQPVAFGEDGRQYYIPLEVAENPIDGMVKGFSIKTITNKGSYGGGIQSSGGGGGGGGRREARRANHTTMKPKRYHKIDNHIDNLTDAYERLNKQEDRAWGKDRIAAMEKVSQNLKDQVAALRAKRQEAERYLAKDKKEAEKYGFTFDETTGDVSNYKDAIRANKKKYNDAVDAYNAMSAEQQEALDKEWKNRKNSDGEYYTDYLDYLDQMYVSGPQEALETYEDTMETWEQLGLDIAEKLDELYDTMVEAITYRMEFGMEITEEQLKLIEHRLKKIEDNAYKTAEAIAAEAEKMGLHRKNYDLAYEQVDNLLKFHNTDWSVEDWMNGNISNEQLLAAGFTQDEIDAMKTSVETMMECVEGMTESMTASYEHMTTAFEEFNEDLERYSSAIEHAQNVTASYRNILDLTGRSATGFTAELMRSFNADIVSQAKAGLDAAKTMQASANQQYQMALAKFQEAQTLFEEGSPEWLEAQAAFEAAEDNLNEATENFMAMWEAALQSVVDAYKSNMETAIEDISKKMAGGLAGGLEALETRYTRLKTLNENYVDDYEKIYQLTKITRDLDDQIDNTSNVRAQKELLKFQKEINNILQSDKKLSEYDLDYLQKKYDLKLAEVALEDAQNAKSQVMMRRDSEGNYNYVYTADENAVEEAEAEYATKLYEMQKANDEYITELESSLLSLEQEMLNAMLELDPSQFASREEYMAALKEIQDFYMEQMSIYNEQLNNVISNNQSLWDNDMKWFNEHYGYKIADAKTFVTEWNETMLAQASGFATAQDFFETFETGLTEASSAAVTAYDTFRKDMDAINATAGHPTETFAQSVTNDLDNITKAAQQASKDMGEAVKDINSAIESIGKKITETAKVYKEKIGSMGEDTEKLALAVISLLSASGAEMTVTWTQGQAPKVQDAKKDAEQDSHKDGVTPPVALDTGGYTGSWGTEGRLALLHQKELVLNATDTSNILASVGALRSIANVIDLNALTSAGGFISLMSSGISGNRETLQQEVHIEASFPAVTDKNQIEDAFTDLVNLAAQYANRK